MNEIEDHPLIKRLKSLAGENNPDRAALARLRRALFDPVEAYPVILPYLPRDISDNDLAVYATLAGLFASHACSGHKGNFGSHMRIAAGEKMEATEHRFVNLLRANSEDLPVLLRQSVSFLRSKDVAVNWEQLRKDMLAWNHSDGYVQKNWARSFWGFQTQQPQLNQEVG